MVKTIEEFEIVFEGKVIAVGEKITFQKVRKTSNLPITIHGRIEVRHKSGDKIF